MAQHVTDTDFDSVVLQSDVPVLVDFWAEWCGPCRIMGPVIDELAKDYEGRAKVVKMNVDEAPNTPTTFGVMSIPNFVIFKNGQPVAQFVGVRPKEDMAKEIDAHI